MGMRAPPALQGGVLSPGAAGMASPGARARVRPRALGGDLGSGHVRPSVYRCEYPVQNWLFTPELQWPPRGKRRVLTGVVDSRLHGPYRQPAQH